MCLTVFTWQDSAAGQADRLKFGLLSLQAVLDTATPSSRLGRPMPDRLDTATCAKVAPVVGQLPWIQLSMQYHFVLSTWHRGVPSQELVSRVAVRLCRAVVLRAGVETGTDADAARHDLQCSPTPTLPFMLSAIATRPSCREGTITTTLLQMRRYYLHPGQYCLRSTELQLPDPLWVHR